MWTYHINKGIIKHVDLLINFRRDFMNEPEMMKELTKIQKKFDACEHKGNANVYLAGSWFKRFKR